MVLLATCSVKCSVSSLSKTWFVPVLTGVVLLSKSISGNLNPDSFNSRSTPHFPNQPSVLPTKCLNRSQRRTTELRYQKMKNEPLFSNQFSHAEQRTSVTSSCTLFFRKLLVHHQVKRDFEKSLRYTISPQGSMTFVLALTSMMMNSDPHKCYRNRDRWHFKILPWRVLPPFDGTFHTINSMDSYFPADQSSRSLFRGTKVSQQNNSSKQMRAREREIALGQNGSIYIFNIRPQPWLKCPHTPSSVIRSFWDDCWCFSYKAPWSWALLSATLKKWYTGSLRKLARFMFTISLSDIKIPLLNLPSSTPSSALSFCCTSYCLKDREAKKHSITSSVVSVPCARGRQVVNTNLKHHTILVSRGQQR